MKSPIPISRAQLNILAVLLNIIIVLIGLTLYGFYNKTGGLPKEIGSGMVASGLAALILVLYQIASNAVENRDEALLETAKQVGLDGYYPSRPDFGFGQSGLFTFGSEEDSDPGADWSHNFCKDFRWGLGPKNWVRYQGPGASSGPATSSRYMDVY
jgi:hypothetical protein